MSDKCKHCQRCVDGCKLCACCGVCQVCGLPELAKLEPYRSPIPQFMPYPVWPTPQPSPFDPLNPFPIWIGETTLPQPLRPGQIRVTCASQHFADKTTFDVTGLGGGTFEPPHGQRIGGEQYFS